MYVCITHSSYVYIMYYGALEVHVYVSYIMVVLYIGIIKVWDCLPEIPPTNQRNINFVTAWQHWLGIAKPKNLFR